MKVGAGCGFLILFLLFALSNRGSVYSGVPKWAPGYTLDTGMAPDYTRDTDSAPDYTHDADWTPDYTRETDLAPVFIRETDLVSDHIKDVEGNSYRIVAIGNRWWMAENLRTTTFNDGRKIPLLDLWEEQDSEREGYAIYPYASISGWTSDQEVLAFYGAHYNWSAVAAGKLCPEGWHIPSRDDWAQLKAFLVNNHPDVGSENVGNVLKSCRQVDSPLGNGCKTPDPPRWNSDGSQYGTDKYGFSALPAGYLSLDGVFRDSGGYAGWWSSSEYSKNMAWFQKMYYQFGHLHSIRAHKNTGFSVRCVRTEEH